MRERLLQSLFCGAVAITCGLGCGGSSGPPLATVSGKVKINDEPVAGVSVIFVPEGKGSPSYGATDQYGNYQLLFTQNRRGAMLGNHHVLIEAPEPVTDDSGRRISATPVVQIPKKYQQPGTLVAQVTSGSNELDFELDAKD